MSDAPPAANPNTPSERSYFKWWICTLLLLATTLNYMDRQALSQTSVQIKSALAIDTDTYSWLIVLFNIGFGTGALLFGWLVDKGNLRWIYAGLVLGWSAVGFLTGFATSFAMLLVCRLLLGVFEAGNWPCGILTVKRVLKPEERSLGNGMFQSGTALGAILIPFVVLACLAISDPDDKFAWQLPFRIIGLIGIFWALLWLFTVKDHHVAAPVVVEARQLDSYWEVWRDRRFYVMIVVIVCVNIPWRSFGEWLPMFLQEDKKYTKEEAQWYSSAYFLAADAGSIIAGVLTLWLVRHGRSLFGSRMIAFTLCAGMTLLTTLAVLLPKGWLLFGVLLLIGFGALGSFSSYFAFSQEISAKHQGKVTGTLGFINSAAMALLGRLQGMLNKSTGSFELALGLTGIAPIVAVAVVWFFWNAPAKKEPATAA